MSHWGVDRRGTLCQLIAGSFAMNASGVWANSPKLDAPNIVVISPSLVTSGQPTASSLAQLGELGFGGVIYLAPPTVPDAVANEAEIVRSQGLVFINIPIKFSDPTEADFVAFVGAMAKLGTRKVLVHCQINLRASTLVFLHRVIVGKESPQLAYESVTQVWAPEGPWKSLLVSSLRKNRIQFEPH